MLNDPLIVTVNFSGVDYPATSQVAFARIGEGHYRTTSSTFDQPFDLILKNQFGNNGIHQILGECRWAKNSLIPGAPDDVFRSLRQNKYPSSRFTSNEALWANAILDGVFSSPTLLPRLQFGEL